MIILDLELSGLNPHKHSIVSLGAIDFRTPDKQLALECRIWDGAHIMDEALEVNGYSQEQIRDPEKMSEAELVEQFLAWADRSEDHTIAGQNVHVDLSFIEQACQRAKLNFPLGYRVLDLHSICYYHIVSRGGVVPVEKGRSSLDSDKVMEYLGLPAEPKPHRALNGAKWEAEAFYRLFYHQPLFDEFQGYPIPFTKEG